MNFFCACSEKRAVSVSSAMRALATSVEVRSRKMLRVFRCKRLCQPARQAGRSGHANAKRITHNATIALRTHAVKHQNRPVSASKPRTVEQHKHKHKQEAGDTVDDGRHGEHRVVRVEHQRVHRLVLKDAYERLKMHIALQCTKFDH